MREMRKVNLWAILESLRQKRLSFPHDLPIFIGSEQIEFRNMLSLAEFDERTRSVLALYGWTGRITHPTRDMKVLLTFLRKNDLLGRDLGGKAFILGLSTFGPELSLWYQNRKTAYLCGPARPRELSGATTGIEREAQVEFKLGLSELNPVEYVFVPLLEIVNQLHWISWQAQFQLESARHHSVVGECPVNTNCSVDSGKCLIGQAKEIGDALGRISMKLETLSKVRSGSHEEREALMGMVLFLHLLKEYIQLSIKKTLSESGSKFESDHEIYQISHLADQIQRMRQRSSSSSRLTSFEERIALVIRKTARSLFSEKRLTSEARRHLFLVDDYVKKLISFAKEEIPAQVGS